MSAVHQWRGEACARALMPVVEVRLLGPFLYLGFVLMQLLIFSFRFNSATLQSH